MTLTIMFYNIIPAFSQGWNDIVKHDSPYLYGVGRATTIDDADKLALADLLSKISIEVQNSFSITEDERTVNGVIDANSYRCSKIQTYSSATLTNTERIVISQDDPDGEICIGRYIKKTEINRIFEGRLRTVKEHIRLGLIAENTCKIDDALRNYYWAFSLLKSVQRPSEFTYIDEDNGFEIHPLTWIPNRIENIFDDINVEIINNDGTNVDLLFKYKGENVNSIDFTYFDGRNWSNISSAKNGRGTIEFIPGLIPDNIQINFEYMYKSQSHINPELENVLSVIKGNNIRGARVNIKNKQTKVSHISDFIISRNKSISPVKEDIIYRNILKEVVYAVQSRNYSKVYKYFTEDGKEMFEKLIKYGNAKVTNTKECSFYQYNCKVVARSIQMSFSFKKGLRRNFIEDVVFTFDENGKIDCVSFGLDKKAQQDILNRGVWPIESRQMIMEFLENYKTAYALKRIEYLRGIFDDDAVIIVGHVVNKYVANRNSNMERTLTLKNNKYIRRTQYSKDQYLKNLESCFQSNEFINIRFENCDVRKAKDGQEYGIQIKQDYYSTNYGDEGYLYIQVDLNNEKQPIIKVRTWQQEPDPEIGLFGLGTF